MTRTLLYTLRLPPLAAEHGAYLFSSPAPPHAVPRHPFQIDTAEESGVTALHYSVKRPVGEDTYTWSHFVFLIPYATFQRLIQQYSTTNITHSATIEWAEWGPEGTCLLDLPRSAPQGLERPIGSLLPVLIKNRSGPLSYDLIMVQLNRWAARRARHTGEGQAAADPIRTKLGLAGDSTKRRACFSVPVVTNLPCAIHGGPPVNLFEHKFVIHLAMSYAE